MKIAENKVPDIVSEIGRKLLENGAAVNRVEDTISRICASYGEKADVFALPSFIAMTASGVTQTVRVKSGKINFGKIEELNQLSRYICEKHPCKEEIKIYLDKIDAPKDKRVLPLAYLCTAAALTVNFGGSVKDVCASVIISLVIMVVREHAGANRILNIFLVAFATGLSSATLTVFMPQVSSESIIGACVILMIPGFTVTTALKDMLCGDTIAGILRMCESILLSLAIATGIVLSEYTAGLLYGR
ncbi:MAG: threonine/serine exporter family protein [Clostridia bacterium]|nr:threonine/serine exporter family protein [Clostridia bacterium]